MRKLMFNWVKNENKNETLKEFSKITINCNKVHFKLIAIYTNILFPEIMPDDLP